jgi:hypothetical protein
MDLKNNFTPNVMGTNVMSANKNAEEVEMTNKLANSAFKKKDDLVDEAIEVVPPSNLDTHVSERSLDFFKKNDKEVRKVQTPNRDDIVLDQKVDKQPPEKVVLENKRKSGNNKKNQNFGDKKKKENSEKKTILSKLNEKGNSRSRTKNVDTTKSPKKINNIKREYQNISKQTEPKKHTTLEEFRKKYNPEKFKQKFQNEKTEKTKKLEKNKNKKYHPKKIISTGNITRTTKDHKFENKRNLKNTSTDKSKKNPTFISSKNMSKSPSTGTGFISSKNYQNVKKNSKSKKNNIQPKTPERKKLTSNITSITQPLEKNIFKTMDSAPTSYNKPVATFKSVTHRPENTNINSTLNGTTSRSRDLRTETQNIRRGNSNTQNKRVTSRETSLGRTERFNTTIVRMQTSVDRYSNANQPLRNVKNFEEHRDEGHRYSLGVRSRTLEKKPVERGDLDGKKKSDLAKDSKAKLSQIFEEPSPSKANQKNNSLYSHLKKNSPKYVNLTQVGMGQRQVENVNNRSKSSDINLQNGQFNRRTVYVNGIKTQKMIYSKSNNDSTRNSRRVINKTENEIKPNNPPEEAKSIKTEEKKDDKESDKKKKYKIITVPQTKARVIQEGGLKFSNVKPITIIQQGNFALSSSRSKNKSMNFSSRNLDEEDKRRVSENKRKSKEPEMITIKTENEKGDTSVTKKRVISYQEYKRRIQKTLQDNQEKKGDMPKPEQKKIILKDKSSEKPKTLIEQYNRLSNQNQQEGNMKQVYLAKLNPSNQSSTSKGPVITRLTRTISKPYLENQISHKNQERSVQKEDDINTLVKKLEQINQKEENPKSKTTGSISLNQLIRQVKQEETPQSKKENQGEHSFGHKKNKTMYNFKPDETREYNGIHRVKSGSSYNNYISPTNRQVSVPKKAQNTKQNYTREEYSKSSQRNYNRHNGGFGNQVKIYKNNEGNMPPGSYKTTSRRTIEQDFPERYSYGRRVWQNTTYQADLKQSNSMKKLNPDSVNNIKSKTINNNNNNYSLNINNANLQPGNVTTTIRRYVINTSPVNNYKFDTDVPNKNGVMNGNHKKQIYTNFKELKKNLKTNFYN